MQRTCPACHEKLTTNDHFFCGNCGSVLEANLVFQIDSSKKVIDLEKVLIPNKKHPSKHIVQVATEVVKITNLKGILLLLLLLLFVGIPTYIFLSGIHSDLAQLISFSRTKPMTVNLPATKVAVETTSSIKPLPLVSGMLGNQEFLGFVPYNVDIYIESSDIYSTLKLLSIQDLYYKELQDLLAPLITDKFAFYIKVNSEVPDWTLVLEAKDPDSLKDFKLSEKYVWLESAFVKNYLLISNNKSMITSSVSAVTGLEKNINMNPAFVPHRNRFNTTAKVVIVALTGEGKNLLANANNSEIPDVFLEAISDHFMGTNNYLVIH